MKRFVNQGGLLFFLTLSIFTACRSGRSPESDLKDCNIILISIDTLRADHLHCYGYERETSPNIDRVASESIVFENAVSQSAWTLPAHASMMTGLLPSEHGLIFYDNEGLNNMKEFGTLDGNITTLAEILKTFAYTNVSYNGGAWIDPAFGLRQGFDLYRWGGRYFKYNVPKSIGWIKANPGKKFFLFLHAFDVHAPYNASPEFNVFYKYRGPSEAEEITLDMIKSLESPEYEYIVSQYDAGIRRADHELGQLFELLDETELSEKTILIITSDHGEMLGERGKWDHIYPLYEELIRVPLIIKIPGFKRAAIKGQVPAMTSILPTILDILGIPFDKDVMKNSLMPLIRGRDARFDVIISETGRIKRHRLCRAIRMEKWKLVYYEEANRKPRIELIDLENDPKEQHEVSKQNPQVTKELLDRLLSFQGSRRYETIKKKIDQRTLEQLKSLGYIQEK
jgi:arylsulfatase A-like enzyme